MTTNDYIAEYVVEKHPNILGIEFGLWKVVREFKNFGENLGRLLNGTTDEEPTLDDDPVENYIRRKERSDTIDDVLNMISDDMSDDNVIVFNNGITYGGGKDELMDRIEKLRTIDLAEDDNGSN